MSDTFEDEALKLLRKLTGDAASVFRDDQLDVIRSLVEDRERLLLVKRTGWGKSAVYFIATKMLRDQGAGPTLVVSPLLALIHNQREAALRMGVQAEAIDSSNFSAWREIESQLDSDEVDLLLISPERLASQRFRDKVLPKVVRQSGLLVIDEAHCISDWGHDFRPDYRRLVRVLDRLTTGIPVLCCTATANGRVVNDVVSQFRSDLAPVRGPLARDGLRLVVLELPDPEARMVWLAKQVPKLVGTGLIYCLTVDDTKRVAEWLLLNGIKAVAYWGNADSDERASIEQGLLSNKFKVVVATSALGMGFDKPDLTFVVHYQSPGSPLSYYQQVGRAGRALPESWGILLCGLEDAGIQDHFIRKAFPQPDFANQVLAFLQDRSEPATETDILASVNLQPKELKSLLRVLEVDNAVERRGQCWLRTLNAWTYDHDQVRRVTKQRRKEQHQMNQYIGATDCRMQLLRAFCDDPAKEQCGKCDNCSDTGFEFSASRSELQRALNFLQSTAIPITPKEKLPSGEPIAAHLRLEAGWALTVWGRDLGHLVRTGKDEGHFDVRLVEAACAFINTHWCPDPVPTWVTYVPSLRHPNLVRDFAERLAAMLHLPCEDTISKVRSTKPQNYAE